MGRARGQVSMVRALRALIGFDGPDSRVPSHLGVSPLLIKAWGWKQACCQLLWESV